MPGNQRSRYWHGHCGGGGRSGLWREMARIVGEVRPHLVFVENSPLLVGRGLAIVLGDLAEMGFDAEWCCVSASNCGAPHQRDRIWLVAYPNGMRQLQPQRGVADVRGRAGDCGQKIPKANGVGVGVERMGTESQSGKHGRPAGLHGGTGVFSTWPTDPANALEPRLGRVANGVAARVDRLKALGNGQVPRVAATAFTLLKNHNDIR